MRIHQDIDIHQVQVDSIRSSRSVLESRFTPGKNPAPAKVVSCVFRAGSGPVSSPNNALRSASSITWPNVQRLASASRLARSSSPS